MFLAPHPEMFGLAEKLEAARRGGANPLIKPGELQEYLADSERDFREQLAKRNAEPH